MRLIVERWKHPRLGKFHSPNPPSSLRATERDPLASLALSPLVLSVQIDPLYPQRSPLRGLNESRFR